MKNKDEEFEDVIGTWANEFKKHWEVFCEVCWKGFNSACKDMNEKGNESKIDYLLWREYVLWDFQKRHKKEKK